MSQPPAYSPVTSFLTYQAQQAWFPGQNLDVEFNALKTSIAGLRANLAVIQQDDTVMAHGVVGWDQLSAAVQLQLTSQGFIPPSSSSVISLSGQSATPFVIAPSTNGVWLSGAVSPNLSLTSVDFAGAYYAQQVIQFTSARDSLTAEGALAINATFSTGYTASPTAAKFKEAIGIWSQVNGAVGALPGAGQVWNISSDMIVNSTYGQAPNNVGLGAFNVELDITNNAYDASFGNSIGVIANLLLSGVVGAFPITAQLIVSPAAPGPTFASHYGIFFSGAFAVKDASILDQTSGTYSYWDTGTHTVGINLAGTYTNASFASTGFSVLPNGTIVSAILEGGLAAGSVLTVRGTGSGSPSGDKVIVSASNIVLQNNAATVFLDYNVSGAGYWTINSANGLNMNGKQIVNVGNIAAVSASGPVILNGISSATAATLIPNSSDLTAGIGGTAGNISIVVDNAGAYEAARFTAASVIFGSIATFTVSGGLKMGAPTGGDKGAGTINMAGALYNAGNQVVSARATGWTVATGTPQRSTFTTGGVTLAQLAGVVMALEQDLIAHGLIGT